MRTEKVVDVAEWDALVSSTYGRPYDFQQQDGCRGRGTFRLSVPAETYNEDEQHDSIPEVVNHSEMGVKLSSWLARDPTQPLAGGPDDGPSKDDLSISLWWERNFYPDIHSVANDLHKKGLLAAADYIIIIDW